MSGEGTGGAPATGAGTVHFDNDKIGALGEALTRHADVLRLHEGGLDRNVPAVPFDTFGLQAKIRELDEQREAFEQRLTRLVADGGEQALMQATYTERADR